jgi:uncharacterized protein (TIGR02145 family)
MKLAIKMMLALCVLCVAAFAQGKHKVAVYMSGKNQTSTQSEIAAFALTDAISASNSFTATERTRDFLNTIKKENYYQSTGAVDESQIAEVGKKSGVRYVCMAELLSLSQAIPDAKESLLIARLIDVESATIVVSNYKIAILENDDAILSVSQKLAKELLAKYERWDESAERESAAVYLAGGGESGAGRILQQLLIDAVSKSKRYAVSERTHSFLQKLGEELGTQYKSGEVDDEQLSKLGVQAGVKYVIALKIVSKVVNIRIIDAKSGDIHRSNSGLADLSAVEKIEKSIKPITDPVLYDQGSTGTFTDSRNGETYRTVVIGGLVWMAENLNYAANGSVCYGEGGIKDTRFIKGIFSNSYEKIPYSSYEIQANCNKYGRLYNFNAAKTACPYGWHLPSTEEWENDLIKVAGGFDVAGKHLKAKNGWDNFNGKSTNGEDTHGFAALPGGHVDSYNDLHYAGAGAIGDWWSVRYDGDEAKAYSYYFPENSRITSNSVFEKEKKYRSIRCVKD